VDEAYFGELVGGTGEHRFRVGDASEIVIPEDVSGELFLRPAVRITPTVAFPSHLAAFTVCGSATRRGAV
jgi:hypothetical protein